MPKTIITCLGGVEKIICNKSEVDGLEIFFLLLKINCNNLSSVIQTNIMNDALGFIRSLTVSLTR